MLQRLANFVGEISDKHVSTIIAAIIVMALFGSFDFVADLAMQNLSVGPEVHAAAQAAIVGIGAGACALILMLARRQRRKMIREELQRVFALNHRLRNSFQVIVDADYITHDDERKKIMLDTVYSMDSTLRQLFPALGVE